MGQPKAKWGQHNGDWYATVGHHNIVASVPRACAELWEIGGRPQPLWRHEAKPPFDLVDLMRLAESELERRLRVTADTMDGTGLVAEREPSACDGCGKRIGQVAEILDGQCELCRDAYPAGRRVSADGRHTVEVSVLGAERAANPLYVSETCIGCRGAGYVVVGGHQKQFCHACHGLGSHTRPATPDEERAMPTTAQGGEVRYADSGPNGPIMQASTKWASRCNQPEPTAGSREWAIAELGRTDVPCDRWLVDREGSSWKRGYSTPYMRFVRGYGQTQDSIPERLANGWRIET